LTEMANLTRRKFVLGLLFASAAGVAAARQPRVNVDYLGKNDLDKVIPNRIGQWTFLSESGLVVPPEDQLSQALYSQLVTRVYADGHNPPIMLLVAQSSSQTGILQIHRPEFCYSAGGYALTPSQPHIVRLPSGPLEATHLTAANDGRTEQIVYWTRVGDHLPTSWSEQRLVVALDNLRRTIPDATVVRISLLSNHRAAALETIDKFIRAMIDSVTPPMRRVFVT
jgi:EpsI family protein